MPLASLMASGLACLCPPSFRPMALPHGASGSSPLLPHLQIVYEGPELNHAFGLCHYSSFLFWTEYRSGSIYRLDQSSKAVSLLRNERPPIFEIRMYDAQQQQGERLQGPEAWGGGPGVWRRGRLGGRALLKSCPHLVIPWTLSFPSHILPTSFPPSLLSPSPSWSYWLVQRLNCRITERLGLEGASRIT